MVEEGGKRGCVGLLSHISFFSSKPRYENFPINAFSAFIQKG